MTRPTSETTSLDVIFREALWQDDQPSGSMSSLICRRSAVRAFPHRLSCLHRITSKTEAQSCPSFGHEDPGKRFLDHSLRISLRTMVLRSTRHSRFTYFGYAYPSKPYHGMGTQHELLSTLYTVDCGPAFRRWDTRCSNASRRRILSPPRQCPLL